MIKEIYGKKIGMTQIFQDNGDVVGVTLVEVEPVCLLEKIDYGTKSVVKIGAFKIPENRVSRVLPMPQQGYFKKLGVAPYKLIREVEIKQGADLSFLAPKIETVSGQEAEAASNQEAQSSISREIGVDMFNEGDVVDVRGKSKGRGFQGGMRRHNWSGQPRSHGHTSHRRIGSNSSNTDPGRVWRGHRMPGHMGDEFRTGRNLTIVKIDKEKNVLFINGSIPGARGSIVKIKLARIKISKAKKKT